MFVLKAGVLGAGTMGAEIAQVISFAEVPVVLVDISAPAVERGRKRVEEIYQRRVDRGRMTASQAQDRLSLLTTSTDLAALGDCDLVIEAVPETLDLKRQVIRSLDSVLSPLCVIGSNTSALSITAMAEGSRQPGRVAGVHFFFPASVMRLVEVVSGEATTADTVETVVSFVTDIRKIPVRVKECPGFVVNRVLMAAMSEVLRYAEETGVSFADLDRATLAGGLVPMGPFGLADQLGLDIVKEVQATLEAAYGPRFGGGAAVAERVARGALGVKSGHGFYDYTGGAADDGR